MGLWTNLHIYQVDNVAFDDLSALNDELMNQGHGTFAELYQDDDMFKNDPNWQGVFRFNQDMLEIANRSEDDFEGYDLMTSIWGCYRDEMWKAISDHMTSGKLVFHIDCEERSYNLFIIMEPGTFKVVKEKDMRPKF